MKRVLIVANRTLGGRRLSEELRRLMRDGECHFHLVVPASHPGGTASWTEGQARAAAQRHLDAALARLVEIGCSVTAEIGDASPVEAVSDAMLEMAYDEIVVSTLPIGVSQWVRADVVHRLKRRFPETPIVHVVAEAREHEPAD